MRVMVCPPTLPHFAGFNENLAAALSAPFSVGAQHATKAFDPEKGSGKGERKGGTIRLYRIEQDNFSSCVRKARNNFQTRE